MNSSLNISIIIPFLNCAPTIKRTLDSLLTQKTERKVELILVDSNSTDSSVEIIMSHDINKKWPVKILTVKNGGMGAKCNTGRQNAEHEIILHMHSDCYVESETALNDMAKPFEDASVVAVKSILSLPLDIWKQMHFWDRVTTARYAGKEGYGMGGKFDALRKSTLDKLNGFDCDRFFSAGEDVDLEIRLEDEGKIIESTVKAVHAHQHPTESKLTAIFRKQAQLGEGFGAVLRKHIKKVMHGDPIMGHSFFHAIKIILFIGLLIPRCSLTSLLLLLIMGTVYSWRAFLSLDWRIFTIPFINVISFFVFTTGMATGFVKGRQTTDYWRI